MAELLAETEDDASFDRLAYFAGWTAKTHQVFGDWSGRLRSDDGLEIEFEGLQDFAEEARQRW